MKATSHLTLVFFFGFNALSLATKAPYFVHTRADKFLPAHCVPFQFSYFDELPLEGEELEARTIYVGIGEAKLSLRLTRARQHLARVVGFLKNPSGRK